MAEHTINKGKSFYFAVLLYLRKKGQVYRKLILFLKD